MLMFEVGKVYEFQPNPGADILVIQIISEAPMSEALIGIEGPTIERIYLREL